MPAPTSESGANAKRISDSEHRERQRGRANFLALSMGGQVFMPMQETFFASRFGQVRDRFGINWMILHQRPMPAK